MTGNRKWRVAGERWWDDDDRQWRWGYYIICPHCGPELQENMTLLRPWREAMRRANNNAQPVDLPLTPKTTVVPTDRADRRKDLVIDRLPEGVALSRDSLRPWKKKLRTDHQSLYVPNSQLEAVAVALLAHAREGECP